MKITLGLCQLLTILFLALKLCHQITWSWWWVLSPLWAPFAISFVVMGLIGTALVAIKVIAHICGGK